MKHSNNTKNTRKNKQESAVGRVIPDKFKEGRNIPPIQAKNNNQKAVLKALKQKQIVIVMGPAGFGKSYLTMGTASDWFVRGDIDSIVMTRPNVSMGKSLGSLPGTLEEKFSPFLAPLIEVFTQRHGKGRYDTALSAGNISMVPIEYMRGRNISGVAILDEAQNLDKHSLFSLITRVTEDGRLWIIGDPTQCDLKEESGLVWLKDFVRKYELEEYIEIIEATSDDIVRGGLCKAFVKAAERDGGINK